VPKRNTQSTPGVKSGGREVKHRVLSQVAVLGSGTAKRNSPLYKQAIRLGQELAEAGFTVYHGGRGGVMEAVARGSKEAGGRNVGVTIKNTPTLRPGLRFGGREVKDRVLAGVNPYADAEIPMPSWKERLFKLIEMGDAYIFLDGATGTLNELFFVWEMANKKLQDKPIILLGKRLHRLVKFLKKDPAVKIPPRFHLVSSMSRIIRLLQG